jgi:hypothetical protein
MQLSRPRTSAPSRPHPEPAAASSRPVRRRWGGGCSQRRECRVGPEGSRTEVAADCWLPCRWHEVCKHMVPRTGEDQHEHRQTSASTGSVAAKLLARRSTRARFPRILGLSQRAGRALQIAKSALGCLPRSQLADGRWRSLGKSRSCYRIHEAAAASLRVGNSGRATAPSRPTNEAEARPSWLRR